VGLLDLYGFFMLDIIVRKRFDPMIEKLGAFFFKNISPLFLTFFGLFFGLIGMVFLLQKLYFLALGMVFLNRLCDGLDGTVSRLSNQVSDRGAYFDIIFDMFFYCGSVLAFIYPYTEFYYLGAVTLFSMMMTGMSFLAFAIFASKYEKQIASQKNKSFFFHNSLVEGTETTLFLIAFCLKPEWFVVFAVIYSVGCWLTILSRFYIVNHYFRENF